MHKLQCVMMCVNQKEFKRIHWCSMREIRPRKMIKKYQKFKKLRARKTKRNMKCKIVISCRSNSTSFLVPILRLVLHSWYLF